MPKKINRCSWSEGVNLDYIEYHDTEWGVPVTDDRVQFEFLILEGAQAGLSWSTILNKRSGYRKNFADFDPQKVARFTKKRIEKILTNVDWSSLDLLGFFAANQFKPAPVLCLERSLGE